MKLNERLWRTLADAALDGKREWPDVATVADVADLTTGNAHHALRRLVEIGAVRVRRRGGLTVLAPEKILTQLSAFRNLVADTVAMTTLPAVNALLDVEPRRVTLGGADAAVHWLGGVNTVGDRGVRLAYVEEGPDIDFPDGDEIRVVKRDAVAGRTWHSGFTSRAQTYADLFATPGWQASEFRAALHRSLFGEADWDQKASADG